MSHAGNRHFDLPLILHAIIAGNGTETGRESELKMDTPIVKHPEKA